MGHAGSILSSTASVMRAIFTAVLCGMPTIALAAPKMYWTELTGNVIQSAELDGTNRTTLISSLSNPAGIALDGVNNKMYWAELLSKHVRRANLDGTGNELVHTNGSQQPVMLAVDAANGKIYWSDYMSSAIRRADLNGDNQEVFLTSSNIPIGVAVDSANSHLYWAEVVGASGALKRINLDGTGTTTIYLTGASSTPQGIALDTAEGKIYWADDGLNMIRRVDMDGSNAENIVTSGLQQPMDVALHGTKVYWVDPGLGVKAIFRADKDGGNVETLLNTGINDPFSIAILGNRAPLAHAGGPYTINEGGALSLNASASTDPDGDDLSFDWDLDNDGFYNDATGATPVLDWATLAALGWNDGVYPIAVRVTDGEETATAATTVTVNNLPPNVVAGGPYVINEGGDLALDASGTTDPGDDPLAFDWDLNNDGTFDVAGVNPTIFWAALQALGMASGVHTMQLRVSDGIATVQVGVGLTILNLPPNAELDTYAVDEDKVLNIAAPGVLANDTDPGGDALTLSAFDSFSAYGALVNVAPSGAFSYDPRAVPALRDLEPGEEALDTFEYTVSDGEATTVGLVEVRVQGVEIVEVPVPVGGKAAQVLTILLLAFLGTAAILRRFGGLTAP